MMVEREKLDNRNQMTGTNKNFNPMISPSLINSNMMNNNMMGNLNNMDLNQILAFQKMHDMMTNNNNHLNYNRGTQHMTSNAGSENFKNLDSELLELYIKKMKDNIHNQMNLSNLNPIFLQSLDAKQLDELIKKISIELSGLNTISNENSNKNSSENQNINTNENLNNNLNENQKNNLRESFNSNLKNNNIENFNDNLNNNLSDTFNGNLNRNLDNNFKNAPKLNVNENENDLDPQLEIFLGNNQQNLSKFNSMAFVEEIPSKKMDNIILIDDINNNNGINNLGNQIKYTDILIKSENYVDPENYNDYMIEFGDEYKNVVDFQLINVKFPSITNLINEYNNTILILMDEDEITVNIEKGIYDLPTLLEKIKNALDPNFVIELNNNIITIKNANEQNFVIVNREKSILRRFGFQKSKYIGENSYTSDESLSFGEITNIHLFVEGVDDDKPLLSFTSNKNPNELCPVNVRFGKPLELLSEIFIKFKYDSDPNSDKLIDLFGESHELIFRIGTVTK